MAGNLLLSFISFVVGRENDIYDILFFLQKIND